MVENISPNSSYLEDRPVIVIETTTFENMEFSSNPVSRREQETDLLINYNRDDQIPVKKSVVVERCPFFASMCGLHGFREASSGEITITYDAHFTIFKALIDYIHTGEITLATDNLEEIIKAAIYFQLSDLLQFCCTLLGRHINLQTVDYIYDLAKENGLSETRSAAFDFKVEHFESIAKSQIFHNWTADRMLELLSSGQLVVSHERKVLQFVFDWLEYNYSTRAESSTAMFREIRFTYLTKENMDAVVKASSNQALCEDLHRVAGEFSNKITPPRVYEKKGIYLFGKGAAETVVFARFWPHDGSLAILKAPNKPSGCKLVAHNDDIYLVGLEEGSDGHGFIHIEKYDVLTDTWKSRKSKQLDTTTFEACIFSASFCEGKIYVFIRCRGGRGLHMGYFEYDVNTDVWQNLPVSISTAARSNCCFDEPIPCGGNIYIQMRYTNIILQFKPSTKEWIRIPFPRGLTEHVPVAYKSKILYFPTKYCYEKHEKSLIVFDSDTKAFQSYPFPDLDLFPDFELFPVLDPFFFLSYGYTVFNESVHVVVFKRKCGLLNVDLVELDLSFVDELIVEVKIAPTTISLSCDELQMENCIDVTSIQ